ncbi:hypothetical protein [Paraburkholderia unamae]|uniref:Lipoprotein n=1 Tax=Paraburkholderia unamae TaxID=219649 RepID=A0ABX5K7G6_9BURK|nr:hypothetical protein [Paraburkholderia unamae]PVX68681.1 hypothetical protein C7402_13814 [Paraburkholderia unamae]RAR49942.1 hypothetical protein C7401_14455 [Paraburkholderia unamae]
MTYSIVLRALAVLLVLVCIGLMAFVACYTHTPPTSVPQAPAPRLTADSARAPRWPDATVRIGTLALLASFVVLTLACLRIAGA